MNERTGIAYRIPRLLVELEDEFPFNSDDPNRFVIARMKTAAMTALENGMRTAAEIVEASRHLRSAQGKGAE